MLCIKCGKEIDDNISNCPYCGEKTAETPNTITPKRKSKKPLAIIGTLAAVIITVGIVLAVGVNKEIRVELTEEHTNTNSGFSFKYPLDWQISSEENALAVLESPNGEVEIKITEYSSEPFDLFTVSTEEAKVLFNEPDTFVELSDTVFGDASAKLLVYNTEDQEGKKRIVKSFCYKAGYSEYSVVCSFEKPYEKAVNEIMESFAVNSEAPANTIAPNEIIYRDIPMNRLFEYSSSDIKEAFGEPLKSSGNFMFYENVSFFFDKASDKIEGISVRETDKLFIHKYSDSPLPELSELPYSEDRVEILKDELGVKPLVSSYEHGAYKFGYDLPNYTMISIYGEYSIVPEHYWFLSADPSNDDILRYNGISVNTLFELSYDDVLNIYGSPSVNPNADPSIYGGEKYSYETLYYPSEDIAYTFSRENNKISNIKNLDEDLLTVNDSSFGEDPDDFSKALGKPVSSNSYDGSITASAYTLSDISLKVISYNDTGYNSISIDVSENTLPYNTNTLISLIGCSPETVFSILGGPIGGSSLRNYEFDGGTVYYDYNNGLRISFNANEPITVDSISLSPQYCEFDGITLNKTPEELKDILGTPYYESYYGDGYYCTDYVFEEYGMVLSLEMPDYYSNADFAYISEYHEEYYYVEPEPEPSYSYTADGYTLAVGSTVYGKEGLLGINYVEGYVDSIDGDTVKVVWKNIYTNNLWAYRKFKLHGTTTFLGTTYKYYDETGKECSVTKVKSKYSANELYAKFPAGETAFGFALEY
ncbi:MAG: hypothetical protein HDT48_02010 [Ruminococcaceae bacterium]|nr:hypothetical protein [Oscillospiraceae bacterium]